LKKWENLAGIDPRSEAGIERILEADKKRTTVTPAHNSAPTTKP
jgi:hypothetical protein